MQALNGVKYNLEGISSSQLLPGAPAFCILDAKTVVSDGIVGSMRKVLDWTMDLRGEMLRWNGVLYIHDPQ